MTIDTPIKAEASKSRRKARNRRYYEKCKAVKPIVSEQAKARNKNAIIEHRLLEEQRKAKEYLREVNERLKDFKPWTAADLPDT